MTKQVKPSVWKLLLVTVAILMAAALLLGATPESQPKFVATAQSLTPPPQKPYKTKPIVISKRVRVQEETPQGAPENATQAYQYAQSQGWSAEQCVAYVCRTTGLCQNGNAGSWQANSSTASVGAVMIFQPGQFGASGAGHVAVVTGVNPDGTVNVRHSNCPGCPSTYPSTGSFYK